LSERIREAGEADLDALLAIDRAYSPVFSRSAGYANLLQERGLILMAEIEETPCAFAAFSQVLEEATLLNLVVVPDVRGTGVARALLRKAWATLRQRQLRRVLLEVRQSNTSALALYASEGFSIDGERRHYYPASLEAERETAVLMSRGLES
jgi:ribosomal-protein-alanine N-acetyltransferase